jgi:hypothetical protein
LQVTSRFVADLVPVGPFAIGFILADTLRVPDERACQLSPLDHSFCHRFSTYYPTEAWRIITVSTRIPLAAGAGLGAGSTPLLRMVSNAVT